MPPRSEIAQDALRAAGLAGTHRITRGLALALAVASGALLEGPDGAWPLPPLALFVFALVLARSRA